MVCRDSHTHKARQVNTLNISTPEEHSLFSMGEGMYDLPRFLHQSAQHLQSLSVDGFLWLLAP